MFSQERMSRQKFALGANMMPIMEYQKGGHAAIPPPPPPRDWSPEWTQVVNEYKACVNELNAINAEVNAIGSSADWQSKQVKINNEINGSVARIDSMLALNATIPTDWFASSGAWSGIYGGDNRTLADRDNAVAGMQTARGNILKWTQNRQPSAYELIKEQVDREVVQLAAIGRIIGRPIEPLPVNNCFPQGSWQYRLWERGYSAYEIHWLEGDMSRTRLQERVGSDQEVFIKYAEDALDQAILTNKVTAPVNQEYLMATTGPMPPLMCVLPYENGGIKEILKIDPTIGYNNNGGGGNITNPRPTMQSSKRIATSTILGVGTGDGFSKASMSLGVIREYRYITVYGDDGKEYSYPYPIWSTAVIYPPPTLPSVAEQIANLKAKNTKNLGIASDSTYAWLIPNPNDPVTAAEISSSVSTGVRWCLTPWAFENVEIDPGMSLPYYDPGIRIGTPEYRLINRRRDRQRGGIGRYIPTNPFTTPHTPMRPAVGFGTIARQLPGRPWCGTNNTHVDAHCGVLMGVGATPAEVDTVNSIMRRSRFTPNANKNKVALRQLQVLRGQQFTQTGQTTINYGDTAGVAACAIPASSVARWDVWNTRQTQRPGRGVIRQGGVRLQYEDPGFLGLSSSINFNPDNNGGGNNN